MGESFNPAPHLVMLSPVQDGFVTLDRYQAAIIKFYNTFISKLLFKTPL